MTVTHANRDILKQLEMKITGLHWLKISQRYYERRAVNDRMQVRGQREIKENQTQKSGDHFYLRS